MSTELGQILEGVRSGDVESFALLINQCHIRIHSFVSAFCPIPSLSAAITTEAFASFLANTDGVDTPAAIMPILRSFAKDICCELLPRIEDDDPLVACQVADGLERLKHCNPENDDVCVAIQNVYNRSRERVQWLMTTLHSGTDAKLENAAARSRRSTTDFLPELFMINLRIARNVASQAPAWASMDQGEWSQSVRRDVQTTMTRYLYNELPAHGIPALAGHVAGSEFHKKVFCQLSLVERILRLAFGTVDTSAPIAEIRSRASTGQLQPRTIEEILAVHHLDEPEEELPEQLFEATVGSHLAEITGDANRKLLVAVIALSALLLIFIAVFFYIITSALDDNSELAAQPSPQPASVPKAEPAPPKRRAPKPPNIPQSIPTEDEADSGMLPNGAFERGLEGWEIQGDVEASQVFRYVYAGKRTCRIRAGTVARTIVGLIPGARYRLSAWARASHDGSQGGLYVQPFMKDRELHPIRRGIENREWRPYVLDFSIRPEWEPRIQVGAYQESAGVNLLVDQLQLEMLCPPPQTIESRELINDGGFEHGFGAWMRAKEAKITKKSAQGKRALLLPPGTQWAGLHIPVKPGRAFAATARIKSEKGEDCFFGMHFHTKDDRKLSQNDIKVNSDTYKLTRVVGAAPPESAYAEIYIWSDGNRKGNILLDDVSLHQVSGHEVYNGGFEEGTDGWRVFDVKTSPITENKAEVHSGRRACAISQKNGGLEQWLQHLEKNAVYEIRFWAYSSTPKCYALAGIDFQQYTDNTRKRKKKCREASKIKIAAPQWREYRNRFVYTGESGWARIWVWKDCSRPGRIFIDDFQLNRAD